MIQDNCIVYQIHTQFHALAFCFRPESINGKFFWNNYGFFFRLFRLCNCIIYGFGFVEAGNNWANYEDFNPFKLYKSAGFGARIFMPAFGLIGLNWAYGFDTLPYASEPSGSQFHFTIGQQIR